MKKKILSIALVVAMVAVIAAGSLAYFTDKDSATNTFTSGNVAIDLTEEFEQGAKLLPATGSAQANTLKNGVEKKVFVTNTGSEDAYVRVHIAIPSVLDEGDPDFDAKNNVLHFNYASESIGADHWDWSKQTGAPYEGDWNYYETNIGGIDYNVYVVTYEKALAKGEKTVDAMHQVYLDSRVTNGDIEQINEKLGNEWKILVAAEGCQADGFDNAYAALNAAFGTPGNYAVDWTAVTAHPVGA